MKPESCRNGPIINLVLRDAAFAIMNFLSEKLLLKIN